jgi:osmoprotectant transport system permease protein
MLAVDRHAWIDWAWLADNLDGLWGPLREHVVLTAITMVIGVAIAAPVSLAVRRWRRLYPPTLWFAGALYTIPALALFAMLIPYTGLSRTTAVVPLVTYTQLILVRNFVTGLDAVPAPIRDAATAMGYTGAGRLWRVELPLALPAIVAGLRLAAVSTIGLATVPGLIGFENLGNYMLVDGFNRDFRTPITVGALATVLLAVLVDRALVVAAYLFSPWRRVGRAGPAAASEGEDRLGVADPVRPVEV